MKHRGPDETESLTGENFAIGFNRLVILSPTEPKAQPLLSPDSRFYFSYTSILPIALLKAAIASIICCFISGIFDSRETWEISSFGG